MFELDGESCETCFQTTDSKRLLVCGCFFWSYGLKVKAARGGCLVQLFEFGLYFKFIKWEGVSMPGFWNIYRLCLCGVWGIWVGVGG